MKKTLGIMASMAGIAMVGTAAYVLMNDTRTEKAKKVVTKAMDDANDMISKKINM